MSSCKDAEAMLRVLPLSKDQWAYQSANGSGSVFQRSGL